MTLSLHWRLPALSVSSLNLLLVGAPALAGDGVAESHPARRRTGRQGAPASSGGVAIDGQSA